MYFSCWVQKGNYELFPVKEQEDRIGLSRGPIFHMNNAYSITNCYAIIALGTRKLRTKFVTQYRFPLRTFYIIVALF